MFSKSILKMLKCVVLLCGFALIHTGETVSTGNFSKTKLTYSRPSKAIISNGDIGNPNDWTMSKANLVAEFFANEPSQQKVMNPQPSQKRLFSMLPPPPSRNNGNAYNMNNNAQQGFNKLVNGNVNLLASGTNFNQQSIAYDGNNVIKSSSGGYSTPFKPIKFPQQNGLVLPNNPGSGYPNIRPSGPPSQMYLPKGNQPFGNGLRPPQPPQLQYLPPPSGAPQLPPPSNKYPPANPQSSNQYSQVNPPLSTNQYSQVNPPASNRYPTPNTLSQTQYQPSNSPPSPVASPPQNPIQYSDVKTNSTPFVPSQQHIPLPDKNLQTPQYAPPSPQILDTYSKQAVYPNPSQSTEKPLTYVTANVSSSSASVTDSTSPFNTPPKDSFTNYESNPIRHPFVSSSSSLQTNEQGLSTESLSQVLAEANAKAGDAMDKTIRFVIHKPEDEEIVKNAIMEGAQNRYEDVRFVQGPTLKVQRKETVYLPPKKKTVVYILLKEPQIDTDVEVMSPQEEDPVPEVYITYQKSDGAVKTKHYSPKPIKESDMKKYLDIEAESYGSGAESQHQPRFSKSTSVGLSTSSKSTSKTSSSSSSSLPASSTTKRDLHDANLVNHRMTIDDISGNRTELAASNSNSTVVQKKPQSPPYIPASRRFLRHPIQCPTVT